MILNYFSLEVGSRLHIRKSHRIKTLKSCFIASSFNFHIECKHVFCFQGKRVKKNIVKNLNFKGSKTLYLVIIYSVRVVFY